MDVYRLLTRSTNTHRTSPGNRLDVKQHLPSAGLPERNDNVIDSEVKLTSRVSHDQGAKRKRFTSEDHQESDASQSPDFFAINEDLSIPHKKAKFSKEDNDDRERAIKGRSKGSTDSTPLLSKEECATVLKRHKLKITSLTGLGESGKESRPSSSKKVKRRDGQLAVQPLTSFKLLRTKYGISRRLAENIDSQGYQDPTEVQLGSLPILLGTDMDCGLSSPNRKEPEKQFRSDADLLAVAPTGSGKTLAFLIPVIQGLLRDQRTEKQSNIRPVNKHDVRALILAPTHELVDQTVNEARKLAAGTGVKASALKKGMKLQSHSAQADDINDAEDTDSTGSDTESSDTAEKRFVKSDILVSTPALLLHNISQNVSSPRVLPKIRFLVLDEADYLLEPLFREQTLGVWKSCINPSLQVSLWSATIGSSIESLSHSFIKERRQRLELNSKHHLIRLIVGLKDSSVPNIDHRLVYAASEQGKLLALRQILHPSASSSDDTKALQPPFLVFTQTIPRAIALHSELLYDISPQAGGASRIAVLHSDLSNSARSDIMAGFRKGEIWILITTDLLSRGVDFRGINGVVNYDIPNTSASYVHRAGRTGRQGRKGGVAVTLYTKEDIPYLKNIANVIAASQRADSEGQDREGKNKQKWLLDALPAISKKTKQDLKTKGVESRRANPTREVERAARKARISTKSGYERRLENRKKGAVANNQRRQAEDATHDNISDDSNFQGFDD